MALKGDGEHGANLRVGLLVSDRTIVVKASGLLNWRTVPFLEQHLKWAASSEPASLVVDLSRATVDRTDLSSILTEVQTKRPATSVEVIPAHSSSRRRSAPNHPDPRR